MNRARTFAAILAAATLPALAACGTTPTPAVAESHPSPSRTAPSPSPKPLPTHDQLVYTLPEIDNLPAGYAATYAAMKDAKTDPASCAAIMDAGTAADPAKSAVAAFVKSVSGGVTVFTARSAAYETSTAPMVASLRDLLPKCSSFTTSSPGKTAAHVRVKPVSLTKLGEDSQAFELKMGSGATSLTMTAVYVAVGRCSLWISQGGTAGTDKGLVEQTGKLSEHALARFC